MGDKLFKIEAAEICPSVEHEYYLLAPTREAAIAAVADFLSGSPVEPSGEHDSDFLFVGPHVKTHGGCHEVTFERCSEVAAPPEGVVPVHIDVARYNDKPNRPEARSDVE